MSSESQISAFYALKNVLITGGTGFMGKVLIWKLLYSCPELNTIYVLIRDKHGKNMGYRKEQFFSSPVFDNFKKENPKVLEKVELISGDVGQEGIGLSDKDRNMLINKVSFIFHGAAILKMNADLRTAVNVNTTGTIRMLDLAQEMGKLEAFVYISTAYCNCEKDTVEEKIYPSKHDPYDVINLTRWMEPKLLEMITPKLIYPSPNTYIYTKRLAETLLPNYSTKVPIIVARPSIVVPSFKEPLPGWNDNFNGPMGLFAAGGKGVIHTTMVKIDAKTDVIPADMVINNIILLPWANSREQLLNGISVYHITQSSHEDMKWFDLIRQLEKSFEKYPYSSILWYPFFAYKGDDVITYTIKCIFLHYLPAYIIDFILMLVGQKTFLVRIQDKVRDGEKVLAYFTHNQWTFAYDKKLQIEKLLNNTDKQLFPINTEVVDDVQSYLDNALLGTKLYLFNEKLENIDAARKTVKIMYVVDKISLLLRYYVFWRIIVFLFNTITNICI
ncbi:putative fatty acyl-CoA reductase CG5065 isoform X2 [Planococcus citri]|uniref:putative fatty acyl-CoA reductase CG5065 isoform X2 n=1 Tax=Planococcus citri TaxID=170843 RepID=UPI0031F8C3A0